MSLAETIETGDLAHLPSRRDEAWRWSDLRGLLRSLPPRSSAWSGSLAAGPFAGADEDIAIVNGVGPDRLTVAPGARRRIALRFVSAPGSGAHSARLAIAVGEGARLTLLESHEGASDTAVVSHRLSIDLAEGARIERIVVADEAEGAVGVSLAEVALSPAASFGQTILTTGARRQRLETRILNPGAGGAVRLDGVYMLRGRRHADITTAVDHLGPGGTADQLVKGVASDQGRGVFQGLITVRRGADQTAARMGHHALLLSDAAEIDAKPELEIHADDVACAHGNTVGALDPEALFYARQRGLSETEARALLTEAFLGAVVDRIEDEGAKAFAAAWIAEGLWGRR